MCVFIGVLGRDGMVTVKPARPYQQSAYYTFMSNPNQHIEKIAFNYPDNIIFNLQKFNGSGLKGVYPRFCHFENEKGEISILSDDKQSLSGFVAFRNRVMFSPC